MWSIKKGIKQILGHPDAQVSNLIHASVDNAPSINISDPTLSNPVLEGWALDPEHRPVQLELLFQGTPIRTFSCQQPRPDVHAAFSQHPYSLTAGFIIQLNQALLARTAPGMLSLVAHFSSGSQTLWTWQGVPEIVEGGVEAYQAIFPQVYQALLESLEQAGMELPIAGQSFPWSSSRDFAYLRGKQISGAMEHYYLAPSSSEEVALHIFVETSASLPVFEMSLRSLASKLHFDSSISIELNLLQSKQIAESDTYLQSARDILGSFRDLKIIFLEDSFRWNSLQGKSNKRVLILYLSDRFSYEYVDFQDLVTQKVRFPAVQFLMPTPYGAQSQVIPAGGSHIDELRGFYPGICELHPSASPGPCWLADLEFFCELERQLIPDADSVSILLPPAESGLCYHYDLKQALIPLTHYESQLSSLESFYASQRLKDRFQPASLDSDTVIFVIPEQIESKHTVDIRQEQLARVENEFSCMSGAGYQISQLAEQFRLAGRQVRFVQDSQKQNDAMLFGKFSAQSLAEFSCPANGSLRSKGKGWIISTCLETSAAAHTLRYLTGFEVINFLQKDFIAQARDFAPELLQRAEWAAHSITFGMGPAKSFFSEMRFLAVTESPIFFDAEIFKSYNIPRKAGCISILAPEEFEDPGYADQLIAVLNELRQSRPGLVLRLLNYDYHKKSHQRLRDCVDQVFLRSSPAEMAAHYAESQILLDLFPACGLRINALEALACGARVVRSQSSGELPAGAESLEICTIADISGLRPTIEQILKDPAVNAVKAMQQVSKVISDVGVDSRPVSKCIEGAQSAFKNLSEDLKSTTSCSVVMPVYGALDCLRPALRTLMRQSADFSELILVNDGSDAVTSAYLEEFAETREKVRLVQRPTNGGFIEACYSGLEVADASNDIILMNSDVVLTRDSIKRLRLGAYSSSRVALASPLSTGSVHLQIELNQGHTLEEAADFIFENTRPEYPTVITPEGQLLYIKRWALQRFGFFDRVFGRGFCEESDLCMRMFLHGAEMICVDNVLIGHRRSASFSSELRRKLYEANRPIFDARWGRYYRKAYELFRQVLPAPRVQRAYNSQVRLIPAPRGNFILDERVEHLADFSRQASAHKRASGLRVLTDAEVVFLLPSIILGGGTLSVLQHVNELILRGVKARVITLKQPEMGSYPLLTRPIVIAQDALSELDWTNQKVIATYWFTAYLVKNLVCRYPNLEGIYYIQDYEAWFYSRPDNFNTVRLAEKSYELGLRCVAKTKFLKEIVAKKHSVSVEVITPGLNRSVFYPGNQELHQGRPRITALFRNRTPRRGGADLLKLIRLLLQRVPEAQIELFGDSDGLPGDLLNQVNMRGSLDQDRVGEHYRNSDILVDMSHWHGFGRMGIESMACGVVPLLSRSGGVERYATHLENALLFDVGDTQAAAEALVKLCCDRDLRLRLRSQGLSSLRGFSETLATQDWIDLLGLSAKYPMDEIPEVNIEIAAVADALKLRRERRVNRQQHLQLSGS